MQVIKAAIAIATMTLCASWTLAATPSAKGTISVSYSGRLSAAVKQDAMQKAKINAVDRYIADFNDQPKERNYSIIRNQVIVAVDSYLLGTTVLSEEHDDKARRYTLVIRADINASRLENALKDSSAMATTDTKEKSSIIFVFVARQQKSAQSFDARTTRRVDTQGSANVNHNINRNSSESEKVTGSKVDTRDEGKSSESASRDTSNSVTTGGSTLRKADVIEWELAPTADINTITTGVMGNAGYEVVDTDNLDPALMQAIRKDYSSSNDLSPATTQSLVAAARALDIPYIAVGTLDVGVKDIDATTGNTRVYIKVNERVIDIRKKLFRTAAAVGPVDFHGLGPSEDVARTNALKKAAGDAAQQLMNALNAKGVQ